MRDQRSIDPLVFEFKSDRIFFPLEISSVLEGGTKVHLHILHPWEMDLDMSSIDGIELEQYRFDHHYTEYTGNGLLHDAIKDQSGSIYPFFENRTEFRFFTNTPSYTELIFKTNLKGIEGDINIHPSRIVKRVFPYANDHVSYRGTKTVNIAGTDLFLGYGITYDHHYRYHENSCSLYGPDFTEIRTLQKSHQAEIKDIINIEERNGKTSHIVLEESNGRLNVRKFREGHERFEWNTPFHPYVEGDEVQVEIMLGPSINSSMYLVSSDHGFTVMDYYDGWTKIDRSEYHVGQIDCLNVFRIPGNDLIAYLDGYNGQTVVIDPFKDTMTQEKLEIMTHSSHLDTYELGVFNETCIHVEWFNDSLYGLVKANIDGSWYYVPKDLLSKEMITDGFKLDYFQPYMDVVKYVDGKNNGRTIFLSLTGGRGTVLQSFSSFDDEDPWSLVLEDGLIDIDRIGFMDLDRDGSNEFAVQYSDHSIPRDEQGKRKLVLIDPENGTILRSIDTCIDTYSMLEDNTLPGTLPYVKEDGACCYVKEDGVHVVGPVLNLDEDDLEKIKFCDIDNDGEGEFILFRYREDRWTEIIYADPSDMTIYTEKVIMGENTPAIARIEGEVKCTYFARSTIYEVVIPDEVLEEREKQLVLDQENVHIETRIITEIEIVENDHAELFTAPSNILALSAVTIVSITIPLVALRKRLRARRRKNLTDIR